MSDLPPTFIFGIDALKRRLSPLFLYVSTTAILTIGAVAQFVSFIVLARNLGVQQFGLLVMITAATAIPTNLCGLGAGEVLIRRVAREPTHYRMLLGHYIIMILSSGTILIAMSVAGMSFLVRLVDNPFENVMILSIFAVSNILLYRCFTMTEDVFFARQEFMRANMVNLFFSISRGTTAILACVFFKVDKLETWALWHGGGHLLGAACCVILLSRYGAPQWRVLRDEIWRGIYSSTPFFLDALRQNIDRLVLGLVATPATIGAYGAASRIVQTSVLTVWSFTRLLYPRLAIAGKDGISAALRVALKYFLVVLGLATVTSVGLFIVAPFMPFLLGKDFGETIPDLMVLCWLVIFIAIQSHAYNALGAAEKHGIRALLYNSLSLFGTALAAGLTYIFGLTGAFCGLFATEMMLGAGMWIAAITLSRQEKGRRARSAVSE